MAILSKESLLRGSDLKEVTIDLPALGGQVRVRSLPAAYSNMAQSEALEMVTVEHRGRAQQTSRINTVKLEALQMLHGLVDPKLDSLEEAETFMQHVGSAWHQIISVIDDISGIDKEAIEKANAMFQPGGSGEERELESDDVGSGNGRSDLPVRVGA